MTLTEIAADLKTHFETAKTDAERFLEEKLPVVAQLAEHAETNPLVDAAMAAVHVSPAILAGLADTLNKFEADLVAALPPEPVPSGVDAEPDPAAVPA